MDNNAVSPEKLRWNEHNDNDYDDERKKKLLENALDKWQKIVNKRQQGTCFGKKITHNKNVHGFFIFIFCKWGSRSWKKTGC